MRLIDADLLREDLKNGADAHANMPFDQYERGAHAAYVNAIDLVDEQPTAQIRIRSRWIYKEDSDSYECDNCGSYVLGSFNYCPFCGADMASEIIHCRECVKKEKCNFYPMQGDEGYCRYGRNKSGRVNPQK